MVSSSASSVVLRGVRLATQLRQLHRSSGRHYQVDRMVQRRTSSPVTRLSQPASVPRATTPTRGLISGEHYTPPCDVPAQKSPPLGWRGGLLGIREKFHSVSFHPVESTPSRSLWVFVSRYSAFARSYMVLLAIFHAEWLVPWNLFTT
jgi:hypothetical protein